MLKINLTEIAQGSSKEHPFYLVDNFDLAIHVAQLMYETKHYRLTKAIGRKSTKWVKDEIIKAYQPGPQLDKVLRIIDIILEPNATKP